MELTKHQEESFWLIFKICLENDGAMKVSGNRDSFSGASGVTANTVFQLCKLGLVDVSTVSVSTWCQSKNRVSPKITKKVRVFVASVYTDIRISELGHEWTRGKV